MRLSHSNWVRRGLIVPLLMLPLAGTVDASDPTALSLLLELPGDAVSVRYTPGSLDRAVSVQERFLRLLRDFRDWARHDAVLLVYLLSREEWERAGYRSPYGLPEPLEGRALALAAWGDAETVSLWQRLIGGRLPMVPGQPFRGSPEEASSLALADLIARVEVVRNLLPAAGYSGDAIWVDGVMAHAVALSTLQRHEATQLPEATRLFAALASRGAAPGSESSAEADPTSSLAARLGQEGWYFEAALLVAEAEGRAPAKALLKWARRYSDRVPAADLVGRYPQLGRWLAAGGGGG